MKFWCSTVALLLSLAFSTSAVQAEKNWPRWRGPHENGHAMEKGLPTKWSENSVTWKTPLKGQGQSSPVIWGERIFLTTALEKGKQRVVMCINRNDGQVVWEKVAWTGEPELSHRMNGWASATCVTDGEHVYAFFGRGGGMFCYTMDGQLTWKKDLGHFETPWGVSACPVLHGDLVIQNCDADKDAYIIGLNKKTGEQVWRTKRDDIRGWSTPILVKAAGRDELVVNGDTGVRAYNPQTGKEYWFCKSYTGRGTPTLTPAAGLLIAVNGKPGPIYAVKPGGNGDVTATHRTWTTKRGGGRDLPSPITIGNYVLVVNMKGILTCYDAKSGKELWVERLAGNYSAAPIAYDGLAFFITEAGETVVVKAGPKADVVGRYGVGGSDTEIFRSSHTPSDGQVFIRSDRVLYCVGKRNAAE
jgi:outer membrane protein assembly factor BamB